MSKTAKFGKKTQGVLGVKFHNHNNKVPSLTPNGSNIHILDDE
jgi:hypothetical protein